MKIIEQSYVIKAPLHKVWQAFVDPILIEKWGGGPAVMGTVESTNFSLWGGDIHGTNVKVIPDKLLSQDWFSGEWDEPSRLNLSFTSNGDETVVDLVQEDVPSSDLKDISEGWKDYYFDPIKELLER